MACKRPRRPDTTCPRSTQWHRFSSHGWTPRSTSAWKRSARLTRWGCADRQGGATARRGFGPSPEVFVGGDRFAQLEADGARVQRPLWASTGVKNPDYSDTLYVTELVAPHTVN